MVASRQTSILPEAPTRPTLLRLIRLAFSTCPHSNRAHWPCSMLSWSARKNPITGFGAGVSVAGGGASVGGIAVGWRVGGAMVGMAVAVGLAGAVGDEEAGSVLVAAAATGVPGVVLALGPVSSSPPNSGQITKMPSRIAITAAAAISPTTNPLRLSAGSAGGGTATLTGLASTNVSWLAIAAAIST